MAAAPQPDAQPSKGEKHCRSGRILFWEICLDPECCCCSAQSTSSASAWDKAAVFICAESIRILSNEDLSAPSRSADTSYLVLQAEEGDSRPEGTK